MRTIFLLFLIPLVYGKCGLYRDFGMNQQNTYNGNGGRPYAWAYSNAYLAVSYFCADEEMKLQCVDAQSAIDRYADRIITIAVQSSVDVGQDFMNNIPNLKCELSVECHYEHKVNGKIYCENMDSYDKCTNATTLLNNFALYALAYSGMNVSPINKAIQAKPTISCTHTLQEDPQTNVYHYRSHDDKLLDSGCQEHSHCPSGSYCNTQTHTCVGCLLNEHCLTGATCDLNTKTCISTSSSATVIASPIRMIVMFALFTSLTLSFI